MDSLRYDDLIDYFADAAHAILIVVDHRFAITYCNRYSAQIFGYSEQELLGRDFFETLVCSGLERDESPNETLRAKLFDVDSMRNRCITQSMRSDGSHLLISWNFLTCRDPLDPSLSVIYCVGNDLTSLTDSFTQFLLTAQGIGFGQWRWNLQDDEGAADPLWYGIRGQTPNRDIPFRKLWGGAIHANDFPLVQEALDSYLRGESNLFFTQFRVFHPQTGWIWIRSTGHVSEWDQSGRPRSISGFEQNITGEISSREKLKKNRELLEEVIKIGQMGYWVYDYSSNKLETLSDTMEDILGIEIDYDDSSRFFGDFESLIHPDDRQRILAALFSPLDSEKKTDCRVLRASGETGYLHIYSHPNHDREGRVVSQTAIFQDITEQKNVEMALREQHLSLFQALRASRAEFWQYDLETQILEVTNEAKELSGLPNHVQKIGFAEMIDEWYHDDDRAWVRDTLLRAVESEGTFEFECRVYGRQRQLKYVRQSGLVDRDATRKSTKILGVVLDISDIRKREKEIQESEARYRILFDQSFDAVAVFEEEKIVQCNARAIELFRAKNRTELLGRPTHILFPRRQPDGTSSREKFARIISSCVNRPTEPFSWQACRLDGSEFEASVSLALVPGTASSIYAMIRDVTQQQSAARAREYYRAYLAILAELCNFFYIRSEKEIIASFLESVTRHFKISKAWYGEVKNRSICPSIHAGEAQGFVDVVRIDLDGKTETSFPLCQAIRERRPVVLNRLDPLRDHSPWSNFIKRAQFRAFLAVPLEIRETIEGGIAFYSYETGMFEDSVFEYLHSGVRELSRLISEKRLRELQQTALEHAKEKAESAAKAKTRFLANMSHEIRTPMTAILGYAEMLSDGRNSPESLRAMAGVVQNNARFLLQILNDILDFSKIEEDKMLVECVRTNLPDLISDLDSFFSRQAREKSIDFHIVNRTPLPEVIHTDAVRLKQILVNLLGNAIKFTGRGSVRLAISWTEQELPVSGKVKTKRLYGDRVTENVASQRGQETAPEQSDDAADDFETLWEIEAGGEPAISLSEVVGESAATHTGMLHFEIADTGIGITSEQVQIIFSPFNQADTSTTRKFGGTGLGLAISRKLIHILHGKFTLQTQFGRGSVFTVSFPQMIPASTKMMPRNDSTEHVRRTSDPRQATQGETVRNQTVPPVATAKPQPIGSRPQQQSQPQPLKGLRILLAEDGKDNQRLFARILSDAGAAVTTADNGLIALKFLVEDYFAGSEFDVVVMDMQMPVMDGYTATQKIRKQGYDFPIIALTAHAMVEERQKCLECGCDDYATKPIMRDELIRIILDNVKRKSAQNGKRKSKRRRKN